PTIDLPNVQTLYFLMASDAWIDNEMADTSHRLELPNPRSLTFGQVNTANNGAYTITKTYITDPRHNTVLIDVDFETKTDADLYVVYDPSLNNSGLHDSWSRNRDVLLAKEKNIVSALISSCGFSNAENNMLTDRRRATGNVLSMAQLNRNKCTLALGFGETTVKATAAARASLARGFATVKHEYE